MYGLLLNTYIFVFNAARCVRCNKSISTEASDIQGYCYAGVICLTHFIQWFHFLLYLYNKNPLKVSYVIH